MITKFRAVFAGLGLLLLSGLSWADGPCPDGQFNPQSSVCMCPGGGFVAPNTYCNKGKGTQTYLKPRWGAFAIDTKRFAGSGHGISEVGQTQANSKALGACGMSTCKTVVEFKNSCGALAIQAGGGPWGSGVAIYERDAERIALSQCARKGGKNCVIWIDATCAGSPR